MLLNIFSSNFVFLSQGSSRLSPARFFFQFTSHLSPQMLYSIFYPYLVAVPSIDHVLLYLCVYVISKYTYLCIFPLTVINSLRLISDVNSCYISFTFVLVFFPINHDISLYLIISCCLCCSIVFLSFSTSFFLY